MHNLSFRNELQLEESIYVCLPDVIAVTERGAQQRMCLSALASPIMAGGLR